MKNIKNTEKINEEQANRFVLQALQFIYNISTYDISINKNILDNDVDYTIKYTRYINDMPVQSIMTLTKEQYQECLKDGLELKGYKVQQIARVTHDEKVFYKISAIIATTPIKKSKRRN